MGGLRLQVSTNNTVKDCCALIFTETWLHSSIVDSAIELARRTLHRWDRTVSSGNTRGGGLCVYINNSWCTDTKTMFSYCCPDLENMTVKWRPLYLPREFTAVLSWNCYMTLLAVSTQQKLYPGGL